jgi:cyclopropane fatty-acyl-phospholipid synthase-like methyltransferase
MEHLMRAAGFEEIEVVDVTKDFVKTAQSWFDAFAARARELRPLMPSEYDDRQKGRQEMIEGADQGLLQRLLVSAKTPSE